MGTPTDNWILTRERHGGAYELALPGGLVLAVDEVKGRRANSPNAHQWRVRLPCMHNLIEGESKDVTTGKVDVVAALKTLFVTAFPSCEQ